jgi:uncharacterized phage-like protein YoqJ
MGRTIAVTGHRPDKLGGYDEVTRTRVVDFAVQELKKRAEGTDLVITGMALGWDMAVAEACVRLEIPFEAALPFASQAILWPYASQERWRYLRDRAARVVNVCEDGYAAWKMQKRNEYMVDRLTGADDLLLALWNGSPGGTANCIGYAIKRGKAVGHVWSDWRTFRK